MRLPVKHLVFSVIPTLALLLLAEAGLRAAGYPSARFISLFPSPKGLYPESAEIVIIVILECPKDDCVPTGTRGLQGQNHADRVLDMLQIPGDAVHPLFRDRDRQPHLSGDLIGERPNIHDLIPVHLCDVQAL